MSATRACLVPDVRATSFVSRPVPMPLRARRYAVPGVPATARRLAGITAIIGLCLGPSQGFAQQPAAISPASANLAVLQPGDEVRLKIWREPDLSGDYGVDETGAATFPKIGPIVVTELSTDSLKALLVSSYAVYLRNPSVEVTFLRRVNVLGEVKNPGLYQVDPTMKVADVLAMAGGVNSDGNPNRIELIREGRRLSVRLSQQSLLAGSPIRSGDQLRVPQRSWMSRNTAVLAAGISATAFVFAALIRP